jgi:hypothetical protein
MRYSEILNELVGVKRFKKMTAFDVRNYIKSNLGDGPVKLLGNGYHGVAIMIGQNVYKMWMKDSAYTDFVNYALQHQDNPFLQQFQSAIKKMPAFFIRVHDAPDYVNYIKIEKLSDIDHEYQFVINDDNTQGPTPSLSLGELCDYVDSACLNGDGSWASLLPMIQLHCGAQLTLDQLDDDLVRCAQTLFNIKNMANRRGHRFDLRRDNFMLRGKQLVITDPLFNRHDADMNRIFKAFDHEVKDEPSFADAGKPAMSAKTMKRNRDNEE